MSPLCLPWHKSSVNIPNFCYSKLPSVSLFTVCSSIFNSVCRIQLHFKIFPFTRSNIYISSIRFSFHSFIRFKLKRMNGEKIDDWCGLSLPFADGIDCLIACTGCCCCCLCIFHRISKGVYVCWHCTALHCIQCKFVFDDLPCHQVTTHTNFKGTSCVRNELICTKWILHDFKGRSHETQNSSRFSFRFKLNVLWYAWKSVYSLTSFIVFNK